MYSVMLDDVQKMYMGFFIRSVMHKSLMALIASTPEMNSIVSFMGHIILRLFFILFQELGKLPVILDQLCKMPNSYCSNFLPWLKRFDNDETTPADHNTRINIKSQHRRIYMYMYM